MATGKYKSTGVKHVNVTVDQMLTELKCPIRKQYEGKESDFEDAVIEHLAELCEGLGLPEIKVIERQRMIQTDDFYIKPDVIVRHVDDSMTVFEVKKANEKYPCSAKANQMTAIGQLLLYGSVLKAMTNAEVRLAVIDNKIYYRTFCAFLDYKLPITLIDFQKNRVLVPYYGWS